jgi:UDP-N-acetyl-D-glucosamine dehydrogenase
VTTLVTKIADKTTHIAVIGLGYVGLPLAVRLAGAGYLVSGLQVDEGKLAALPKGRSHSQDVELADVARMVRVGTPMEGC